ncbi:MAG: hypothetical protein LBI14_00325 [Treponema sp.]|jgi:hypothetical protein|nr:hypothetical protein [Treponema sp.]
MAINKADPAREKRKAEIIARARKVYDISFDYHLTHAIFGADKLLVDDRAEAKQEEIQKVNADLRAAAKAGDKDRIDELMGNLQMLKRMLRRRKYTILIEYSTSMRDEGGGRVINVDGKQLVITLPKKNLNGIMDEVGQLQKEPVLRLRETMAHELGHIVLHTDEFNSIYSLNGSRAIKEKQDWEADVFRDELLRLYCQKDHHINLKSDETTGQQPL